MKWIKIWTEETVKGTTFVELDAASRGIWFSLLALAGVEGIGVVQAGIGRGYSNASLSDILNVSIEQLTVAITKLVTFNKIKLLQNGEIEIINWQKYQDEYHRQRPYRKTKFEITKKNKQLQEGLQQQLQEKLHERLPADKDKTKKKTKTKEEKKLHKEFVYLTDPEFEKLKIRFGTETDKKIETLNNYIGSTGKKYASHYYTILNWSKNEVSEKPKEPSEARVLTFKGVIP